MTPAARTQAAIELLDEVIAAARSNGPAADTLIARYFKTRRYAGAKDRRAVRDLVYAAIRRNGAPPPSGRAAMIGMAGHDTALAVTFDGSAHGPAPIGAQEQGVAGEALPQWIDAALSPLLDAQDRAALMTRAPLHLRVNGLKADRDALLPLIAGARAIAGTRHGIVAPEGSNIEAMPLWDDGLIEVQDAGSQIIVEACGARSGMTVLDLCAGAGGKTLALAAEMGGEGRLIAADTVRDRLARLTPRAGRAGAAAMLETLLLDGGREADALAPLAGACDVVLVDAPCTGSGTWRRNPEARWRLTLEGLGRTATLQAHILDLAAPLVRPGGALVFAVCSLFSREGADQASAFLARHPGWRAETPRSAGRADGPGTLLTPARNGTDGFFFARLLKPC